MFIVSCAGPDVPREALESYLKGKQLYISGDLEEARSLLAGVRRRAPQFSQNSCLLGKACYFLGEYEEAETVWRESLDRNPHHIDSCKWLARLFLQQGQAAKAAGLVEDALTNDAEDPELLILLARAKTAVGDHGSAIQLYQRVQLFEQELARARIELAEIYQTFGLKEKALPELERAEELLDKESPLRLALRSLLSAMRGEAP